jgi:hypothetical protein
MPAKAFQKDNTSLGKKLALRRVMLQRMQAAGQAPIVIETHGGAGKVWAAVYAELQGGIVFQVDADKAEYLALQRPTWAVYQSNCIPALAGGCGSWLAANVFDIDPYGEPWPVIDAILQSDRPKVSPLYLVVNDGLRQKLRMGGAWNVGSMYSMVVKYGNDLFDKYLTVCEDLLDEKARENGYRLARFAGFYCGHLEKMTQYLAVLESAPAPAK